MPSLFPRRRKQPQHVNHWEPSFQPTTNSQNALSFMEQRIHPNLNSLADELSSSQGHNSNKALDKAQEEAFRTEAADFIGLEPSTRRRFSQQEERIEDKKAPVADPFLLADGIHIEAYDNSGHPIEKEPAIDESSSDTPPSCPSTNSEIPHQAMEYTEPSSITRCSTFGKRPGRAAPNTSGAMPMARSLSRCASQSSLSQPRSRATSHSRYTSDNQPQTPGSQTHSLYTSTPYSRATSSNQIAGDSDLLPSPHTFGMPSPPHLEPKPELRQADSYFNFKEIPPPLPPLDHPAFREAPNTLGLSSSRVETHRSTRHFHSLPSLKRSKGTTRTESTTSTGREKDRRQRSKSSAEAGNPSDKDKPWSEANKIFHSRSQSRSSVGSSRRSSAEYSAKQATSAGDGGCWEVDVSKAMIRLALEGEVERVAPNLTLARTRGANITSFSGKARGGNRPTGEVLGLGSPFFLQDTLTHYLADSQLSNGYRARTSPNFNSRTSKRVADKVLRDDIIMSHGESIIPASGSSANTRKGKEVSVDGSPSPTGPHSRRGGRTSSSASATARTPSPRAIKTDTAPLFGSMQGSSSLLAPPALTVIAPTPDASPVSPTRRTHHKSTPTMPTKSALRTPSTPPVIEKSYSSGSAKRKASEADVGGDKTPPKDTKEPRATFAPDPRTLRVSATSSLLGHAPSSFNRSKRVRLTDSSDGRASSRAGSRAGSLPTPEDSPPNAKSTGSWSSRGSHGPMSGSSHTSGPPPAPSASHASHYSQSQQPYRPPSRQSLSQVSIPISALVSPHAPSVAPSGTFHMRDPRKPLPIQSTPWTLSFPSRVQDGEPRWAWKGWVERGGSPLHAWLFFVGFIIFPLWWAAALCIPIPRTRRLGGSDAEKGVVLDDPQVEHDAQSWRTRCRVMAVVSLFTYIPFIVLVAIFA